MKKYLFILTALVLAAALGLAACGGAGSASAADSSSAPAADSSSAPAAGSSSGSASAQDAPGLFDFSAETLDGGSYASADLSENKITMVNIWATWCGYCIQEMPDLQKVYENLPEGAGMISICTDGADDPDLARTVLSDNGCAFPALLPNETLQASLLQYISGLPTTVFVDADGNIVGKAQVGVPRGADTAQAYLDLIRDRLTQVA